MTWYFLCFFFSSRRRHTRWNCDWSSDVCSSDLAFNRGGARGLSLGNETGRFYFGLGDGRLFTEPLRPNFPNELIPIFYSETWGDYWEFFLVYAKKGGTYLAGRELEEGARGSLPGVATNR